MARSTSIAAVFACMAERHRACVASGRLIDELRIGADMDTHPGELDTKQITRLHQLLHEAKFKDPDGSHLSPAGNKFILFCKKGRYSTSS